MPSIFKFLLTAILALVMFITLTQSAPTDLTTHDFEDLNSGTPSLSVRDDTTTDMALYYVLYCKYHDGAVWSGVPDHPLTAYVCENICDCGLLMGQFSCATYNAINATATTSWCYLYWNCGCVCGDRKRDVESAGGERQEGGADIVIPPAPHCAKQKRSVLAEELARANGERLD